MEIQMQIMFEKQVVTYLWNGPHLSSFDEDVVQVIIVSLSILKLTNTHTANIKNLGQVKVKILTLLLHYPSPSTPVSWVSASL